MLQKQSAFAAILSGASVIVATGLLMDARQVPALVQSATTPAVNVLRVVKDTSEAVILPSKSVDVTAAPSVLTVQNGQVTRVNVELSPWRGTYVRIDGLASDSLVIVDTQGLKVGQLVSANLLNPEAGQSGALED